MTNRSQNQYAGGISPPTSFDEAADAHAKAYDAKAVTMSPERTGQTSQYSASAPIPPPPNSVPAVPQPSIPLRSSQADLSSVSSVGTFKQAFALSLNGTYEFLKNWAIAALFFSVMYLAENAVPNRIAAATRWIVNPELIWSVFLALFMFGARRELLSWGKTIIYLTKSVFFQTLRLSLLLAWIFAYIFASALLS